MLNNNNFTIMSVDQFPIITMQVFPETLEHANNWIAEMDLVLAQNKTLYWFTHLSTRKMNKRIWRA